MTAEICGKCRGLMLPEKLAASRNGHEIWEWSCLTCGLTSYKDHGEEAREKLTRAFHGAAQEKPTNQGPMNQENPGVRPAAGRTPERSSRTALMNQMTAPFHYYGGKRRWAKAVWDRLGNPGVYLEPCGGSLAVLLGRTSEPRTEIVCDTSGHICNLWRAVQSDPGGVARAADYPTFHQDLTARHRWLMEWARENAGRLSQDPMYCDVRAAGWWAWGTSSWPGSGWCLIDEEKRPKVPDGGGQGVQAQRTGLEGEIGAWERLMPWIQALARRLARVVVLNRDWKAAVTPTVLREHRKSESQVVGIFLDPPYRTAGRKQTLYQSDLDGTSDRTAEETWEWARFTGERYRIAYACREGDVEAPRGWEKVTMDFGGVSKPEGRERPDMVLFSPACIVPQPSLFGPDF